MFITTYYYCTKGKGGGLKVKIEIIRSENVDNYEGLLIWIIMDVPVYT